MHPLLLRLRPWTPLPPLLVLLLAGCASAPLPEACERGAPLLSLDGRTVLLREAEAPRAVLVLFHGLGETACTWDDRTEGRRVADEALERGFTVIAPSSGAADKRYWRTGWPGNLDVPAVDEALDALLADSGLPMFALGHSNGGTLAPIWAEESSFEVLGAVNANGWGSEALGAQGALPPLIFVSHENDLVVPPATTEAAADRAAQAEHAVTRLRSTRLTIEPLWFTRVDGIDADESRALRDALERDGLLDEQGRLASNPRLDGSWRSSVPDELRTHEAEIEEQLHLLYAEHRFSSEHAPSFFAAFEDALR